MSATMRPGLGINGRFLLAPVTGVQRFAHEVVRRIARERAVTLFVPAGTQVPADFAGEVVTGRLRRHLWEQLELPRAAAGRCDVLLHPANTAAARTPKPYVLVLHDVLPLTDPAWFARPFAGWQRIMTPRAARAAARLVTVSEWSRRTICEAAGVEAARVLVAPQGLSPFTAPASDEAVAEVRARFDLPPRFVLAVGADARKNAAFLIAMIEHWRRSRNDAPALVIAGSTQRHVHGSRAEHAVNGNVRVLGRVTDEELRALYTIALVLCSPSHAEGLGRTPLEAIGCGTPALLAPYGPADTLTGVASARVVPLAVDAWIAAIRELETVPLSVRTRDAAALHGRWTWDAATAVVLQACTDAYEESAPAARGRAVAAAESAIRVADTLPADWQPARTLRVALVHDWLTGTRGGERVLEALAALLPGADLFTLLHVRGTVPATIESLRIGTSFVDALPGIRHYYRYCLPLFPVAIERLDLSGYDLIVSSSHCVAKAVKPRGARHLSYCHTPMRYVWDQRDAYLGTGRGAGLRRALLAPASARLRQWDAATASRVDAFVANSEHVRCRIRTYYGREARVVYPPVEVERFSAARERDDVYVCAGALVPYKRVDVAIAAFNRSGRQLLVVGDGPEYRALRRNARTNVRFAGRVPDGEMAAILGRARALVMPMVEDFGIIAVEAQAAGAPVIAYGAGGALESVVHGVTGVHFARQTPGALEEAVAAAERMRFDPGVLRRNAARFDTAVFRTGMRTALTDLLAAGDAGDTRRASAQEMAAACT